MAIRIKNLDLETPGMKQSDSCPVGDVTGTFKRIVWSAPMDCIIDSLDVYANEAMPPQANTASVTIVTVRFSLGTGASASFLQTRGTSANGVSNSDNIVANTRYRLIPSANNSVTVGTPITLDVSGQNSGNLSAALVVVNYTPQKHRNTR